MKIQQSKALKSHRSFDKEIILLNKDEDQIQVHCNVYMVLQFDTNQNNGHIIWYRDKPVDFYIP